MGPEGAEVKTTEKIRKNKADKFLRVSKRLGEKGQKNGKHVGAKPNQENL